LSWHQRPSAQEALISHLCARAAAAARPAAAHRTPRRAQSERVVCVRTARGTSSSPALWPSNSNFTSLPSISPRRSTRLTLPAQRCHERRRPWRACLPAYRITPRQPRSNATGLATLIVGAPDNLCLVGQVQAVPPRSLPAIPVPVCLT